jgi:uncharacterized protein (TIGR02231 family)
MIMLLMFDEINIKLNAMNSSDFPFLAGDMNVFFDGNFVSKSQIGNVAKFEKFEVFLGSDPSVKVEYKLPHKLRETKGLLGGTIKMNVTRRTTIKNTKSKAIQMTVMDQLPLSTTNSIVVLLTTPELNVKDKTLQNVVIDGKTTGKIQLHSDTNNIEWNFTLNASTEVSIPYHYSVSWPSHQTITPDY